MMSLVPKRSVASCISIISTLQTLRRVSMKMAKTEPKHCPGPEVNSLDMAKFFQMTIMRTYKIYNKVKIV